MRTHTAAADVREPDAPSRRHRRVAGPRLRAAMAFAVLCLLPVILIAGILALMGALVLGLLRDGGHPEREVLPATERGTVVPLESGRGEVPLTQAA